MNIKDRLTKSEEILKDAARWQYEARHRYYPEYVAKRPTLILTPTPFEEYKKKLDDIQDRRIKEQAILEAEAEAKEDSKPAARAIEFALENSTESPMEFLRCWFDGDFESIRREWPEAPDAVFKGADTLFGKGGKCRI